MDGKFGMAWLDDFDTREVAGSIVVTAELSGDSPSRVSVYEIHKRELRTLRGLPVPAFTTVFIPGSSTADLKAWLHSVDDVAQATLSPKVPSLAAYASWQVVEILDILQ